MSLFDDPGPSSRVRWRDASLDFKLLFVWAGAMFALIVATDFRASTGVSFQTEILAIAAFALSLISISLWYRTKMGWHWPGMTRVDVAITALCIAGMAIFYFVFFQPVKFIDQKTLPEILFVGGIVVYNLLGTTNWLQHTNAQFLACCRVATITEEESTPTTPIDPVWKRIIRGAFYIWFIVVWLEAMSFFYVHEHFLSTSTLVPTSTHTEQITEHGGTTYVTASEKSVDDLLKGGMAIGIPSVFALGFFFHLVLRIRIFSNLPVPGDGGG
jgi:hypothetical protein